MNEIALTTKALNQLEFQTGLVGRVQGYAPAEDGCEQCEALIQFNNTNTQLVADLREWATLGDVSKVIDQVRRGYDKLLICDYIGDEEAQRLREAKVNYLDNVGNAYLDLPPVFVLIQGKKPRDSFVLDKAAKLFTETGLKVIFALLANRDLLNANYRKIADCASVSMGTIGWVLRELKSQGFTHESSGVLSWQNRDRLIKKWVEEFPTLKSKYLIGSFYTNNENWWQTIDLDKYNALLGGEIAAVNYADDFRPRSGEVYVGRYKHGRLVRDLELVDTDHGNGEYSTSIDVYNKFWGCTDDSNLFDNVTHPLISYASLMDTWDPKSRELATKIAEKFL